MAQPLGVKTLRLLFVAAWRYTVQGSDTTGDAMYYYCWQPERKSIVHSPWYSQSKPMVNSPYLGAFVYQNNVLQYFGMEEGRIRPVAATTYNNSTLFAYDYVLKDHLGNTRVVLTDELQQDVYVKLDFEGTSNTDQRVINQSAVWDNSAGQAINVLGVRIPQTTVAGFTTSNGSYISSVTSNPVITNSTIGAAKLLKVMAGDQLNVSLDWEYSSSSVSNSAPNGLGTLLNSLAGMVTGSPDVGAVLKGQAATIAANVQSAPGVGIFFTPELTPNSGGSLPPMAYLHVLLFSDQFVFDATNSYVQQITTTANHAVQTITPIVPVPKSGYAYIYFSNESATTVYFDNFNITHVRGPLLETDNYYPFGLAMAGISSQAAGKLENKLKYNGKEIQHKEFSDGSGLEWIDYGARMYDQQIGRLTTIDPNIEKHYNYTPYAYVYNDPIKLIDPDGKDSAQRAKALQKAQEYVDKKPAGNQYEMGAKNDPGDKVDCSGLVSKSIVAGGEKDPNHGDGTGVQNIQENTTKVNDKDVQPGNVVTFKFDKGYPYHTGILVSVEKDKDGNITSFVMINSISGTGPKEQTVTIGEGKLGKGVFGYYKWDTKPDKQAAAATPNITQHTPEGAMDDILDKAFGNY